MAAARAPGEIGTYLGLTGEPVGAADAMFCDLADALVPSAALPDLASALAALAPDAGDDGVRDVIARFAQDPVRRRWPPTGR